MAKLTIINKAVVETACKTYVTQDGVVSGVITYLDCEGVEKTIRVSEFTQPYVGYDPAKYFCAKAIVKTEVSNDIFNPSNGKTIPLSVYDETGCNIPKKDNDDIFTPTPSVNISPVIEAYVPEKTSLELIISDVQDNAEWINNSEIFNRVTSVKMVVKYPQYNDGTLVIENEMLPTIIENGLDIRAVYPVSSMESNYAYKLDEQAREDFRFDYRYGCIVAHLEVTLNTGEVFKSNYITACQDKNNPESNPYIGDQVEDPEQDWRDPYDDHMNDVDQGYEPDYDRDY